MRLTYLAATIGLTLACATPSAIGQSAPTCTTFNATGAEQTFVVPAGTNSISITANGAQGADATQPAAGSAPSPPGTGGNAATVTGDLSVSPGETLYLHVGMRNGFNGGGAAGTFEASQTGEPGASGSGGGATDVRQGGNGTGNRVLVAAGGGGGSAAPLGNCSPGAAGNGAGADSATAGTTGGGCSAGGTGGDSATGSTGGVGGTGNNNCGATAPSGIAGALATGGTGGNGIVGCSGYSGSGGGGGGGGYYGGGGGGGGAGGGGGSWAGGGGGGGVSFTGGVTNGQIVPAAHAGDGDLQICYAAVGVPVSNVPVPANGRWMLLLMTLLLAGVAGYRATRRS
ncbi:MAG: hypothetical protein WCD66_12470 [Rhodanobacteraceae bacterium]